MTMDVYDRGPLGDLRAAAAESRDWLCNVAAPLWATRGRTPSGLFAERISLAGIADPSYFRTFVQARHIFSFCAIGEMGWQGPWQALVGQTIDLLIARARRADGFFVHRLDANGDPLDGRADLYDQAFVLFSLGAAGAALQRSDCFDVAEALLSVLERHWSHPAGGFTEGEIVDSRIRRQNPHMHLFEAAQALAEASGRARFEALAQTIGSLAIDRFLDRESGALLEYFDDRLVPAAGEEGKIAEPGHCFEWAWLFERMAKGGWPQGAAISDALTGFARRTGIAKGVAINEVLVDGTVRNADARLWPQTERIKAAVARFQRLGAAEEAVEAVAAVAGLQRYFDVAIPGLWRDKLKADGSWVEELAPGSSLYHIACAVLELHRATMGAAISA